MITVTRYNKYYFYQLQQRQRRQLVISCCYLFSFSIAVSTLNTEPADVALMTFSAYLRQLQQQRKKNPG